MTNWKRLARTFTAKGVITADDTTTFKKEILADGRISREEAETILHLKRTVKTVAPEFDQFLFDFIKKVVLADGTITANETAWLRNVVFLDGHVDVAEKKLLKELKDAVLVTCPAFDELCAQYESV